MFIQAHMIKSSPPGNLNRDDTGQPKQCVFGQVTRARTSSQCLKRNIRHSTQFKEAFFGDELADRTTYLPKIVADELKSMGEKFSDDELTKIKKALIKKFKGEEKKEAKEEGDDNDKEDEKKKSSKKVDDDHTPQLVFFPQAFAHEIASLILELRNREEKAYASFLGDKINYSKDKDEKKEEKKKLEKEVKSFEDSITAASNKLTVDIGLFGRMTTSDLVINVEASCQVAHAISTHETLIESDYFTAMDDRKEKDPDLTQTEKMGAAFLGSGETETFFNSAVYYHYLNFDLSAFKEHLKGLDHKNVADVAGVLIEAMALATPTGKQNSFAAHGMPDLILIELSEVKRPISYANAFLQPVEGGAGRNLMTESAKALKGYIESVGKAFAPSDLCQILFAVGPAEIDLKVQHNANTLDELIKQVVAQIISMEKGE